eukprot:3312-Heterococcus_DN1.PRE.2
MAPGCRERLILHGAGRWTLLAKCHIAQRSFTFAWSQWHRCWHLEGAYASQKRAVYALLAAAACCDSAVTI